jgi:endonuclease/exonuclease/phosphatase family metal-dependent hydrolase
MAEQSLSFRLMTYNVHHCRGTDGLHLPHRIAEVIADIKPDIVALQELDVDRPRTGHIDQPRLIADYLKMDFQFFPCFQIEEEQYGNAVLSHFPMKLIKAHSLPTLRWRRCESRGALSVEIETSQGPFQLITTHLGLSFRERLNQVRDL